MRHTVQVGFLGAWWPVVHQGGTSDGGGRRRVRPGVAVTGVLVGLGLFALTLVVYPLQHPHLHLPPVAWVAAAIGDPAFVLFILAASGRLFVSDPMAPPALGRLTGRIATPPFQQTWRAATPTADGGWRWRGGINAPHWLMWYHGPLASLTISPQRLTVDAVVGRLLGVRRLELAPSDEPHCYPVANVIGRRGVAIYPRDERPWYFWTGAVSEVLSTLAWAGFSVSWEERKPKFFF